MHENRFLKFCRRVLGAGLAVAALATGSALADAAATGQMAEARGIVDACATAETQLKSARDLAGPGGDPFLAALYSGQSSAALAYHLSLAAPWPAEITRTRHRFDSAMLTAISKLAPLDKMAASMRAADVRTVLDKEITRIHRAAVLIEGLAPPPASVAAPSNPAPAPPPPAPAPTPAPSASIPALTAGTGFSGPTAQPAAIGTGPGSGAQAIARWDVVPNQTISAKTTFGVVAFHINGIDRVEFSLNGGAWAATNEMTQNSVTGVKEYNCTVDPATFTAGDFEIRAVAYPKTGVPRVLEGLTMTSVSSASYDPVCWVDPTNGNNDTAVAGDSSKPAHTLYGAIRTIAYANHALGRGKNVGGGKVYLKAGHYSPAREYQSQEQVDDSINNQNARWLTITRDPNTARSSVIIDKRGAPGFKWVQYDDVSITITSNSTWGMFITSPPASGGLGGYLWYSNCDISSYDRYDGNAYLSVNGFEGIWRTDCNLTQMFTGDPSGPGWFVRNETIDYMVADVWTGWAMVINSTATHVSNLRPDGTETGIHTDVYQTLGDHGQTIENLILYGVTVPYGYVGQGTNMSGATLKDVAFVDVSINNVAAYEHGHNEYNISVFSPIRHMYFKDCNFVSTCRFGSYSLTDTQDCVIENTTLSSDNTGGKFLPGDVTGVTYK
jgi:hypothetical protein